MVVENVRLGFRVKVAFLRSQKNDAHQCSMDEWNPESEGIPFLRRLFWLGLVDGYS